MGDEISGGQGTVGARVLRADVLPADIGHCSSRVVVACALAGATSGASGALLGALIRTSLLGAVTGLLTGVTVAPIAAIMAVAVICRGVPTRRQLLLAVLVAPTASVAAWFGADRVGRSLLASQAECSGQRAVELLSSAASTNDWAGLSRNWSIDPPRSCMFFGGGLYTAFTRAPPLWRITTDGLTLWESADAVDSHRNSEATVHAFDEPALCLGYADEWGNLVLRCVGPDRVVDAHPMVVPNQ